MKLLCVAAAMLAFVAPATAQAGVYVFNGVCGTTGGPTCSASTNGAYGNSVTLNSGSVQVKISAWQMNQATTGGDAGKITSAYLGAYSGGFGVTGVQDNSGAGNLHQIDNVNGYTDFVLLQFDTYVHLDSINQNVYGISNVFDGDASFANGAGIAMAAWNSNVSLTTFSGAWSTTASTDKSGTYSASLTNGAGSFSKVWLVSASMLTPDRDDGFKLSSITVTTPSVPEPATWAMLMVGFGAIGATLRRRRGAFATALA